MFSAYTNEYETIVLGTCSTGSVVQGGTINLSTMIADGTSPYDIIFYKIAPGYTTKQILFSDPNSSGIVNHQNVTVPINDIAGDWIYGIDVIDHCTGVPKGTCGQSCIVTVTPVENICTWISGIGGISGITIPKILVLVDAYLGITNIGFMPTITQILGVVDYYLGFTSSGNSKTGCNF